MTQDKRTHTQKATDVMVLSSRRSFKVGNKIANEIRDSKQVTNDFLGSEGTVMDS
jgi:hypothetical protein